MDKYKNKEKVIAIMDKPKDCQSCAWAVCKYATPLSTNRKGYYCQLKELKERNVEDFDVEDDVHLENCPLVGLKKFKTQAFQEFINKLDNFLKEHIVAIDHKNKILLCNNGEDEVWHDLIDEFFEKFKRNL